MTPAYAKTVARWAYVWGWPMVNMMNRRAAITQAPEPGRLNGVLPVAPRGQIAMLSDYIDPGQTFVTCPNQDVVYGLGFFSLDEEPVVIQVPDFGDRFWVYALYDARTDQFARDRQALQHEARLLSARRSELEGREARRHRGGHPQLDRRWPTPFRASSWTTRPRTARRSSRASTRSSLYPLKDFDGKMKTKDWSKAPTIPGPKSEGGGETKWVVPEKFFDQLRRRCWTSSPPLPGEEALYGQFRAAA